MTILIAALDKLRHKAVLIADAISWSDGCPITMHDKIQLRDQSYAPNAIAYTGAWDEVSNLYNDKTIIGSESRSGYLSIGKTMHIKMYMAGMDAPMLLDIKEPFIRTPDEHVGGIIRGLLTDSSIYPLDENVHEFWSKLFALYPGVGMHYSFAVYDDDTKEIAKWGLQKCHADYA